MRAFGKRESPAAATDAAESDRPAARRGGLGEGRGGAGRLDRRRDGAPGEGGQHHGRDREGARAGDFPQRAFPSRIAWKYWSTIARYRGETGSRPPRASSAASEGRAFRSS